MSRPSRAKRTLTEGVLEPTVVMPRGGTAPRCQAVKKDGTQCKAPARAGVRVCVRHGAGLPSRERAGERKSALAGKPPASPAGPKRDRPPSRPPGRPPVHGLYSRAGRQKIAVIVAELEAAEVDLDDSDGEMRVLRATLAFLLGQQDVYENLGDKVRSVVALLEASMEHEILDGADAAMLGRAMGEGNRLLGQTESWVRALLDASRFIVKASKDRAETRAKVAETRALATLTRFVHVVRNILWDTLDEEHLDVLETRLLREVFHPNGVEMPKRDDLLLLPSRLDS